ncbi:MAG: OmpA family protein [Nitrospirota bacterium]
MQLFKTSVLVISLVALAGCGSLEKDVKKADLSPICDKTHGWTAWSDVRCNPPPEAPRDLAAELAAAQKQNGALSDHVSDLERQLAQRDRELGSLRAEAGESARLASQLAAARSTLDESKTRVSDLERQLAAAQTNGADKDKLVAELAAARQLQAELEAQRAERDKELAGLRSDLSAEMAKLQGAERGLIRALRPEIEKGDITINLNNERLLINLASGYLFGSGEDQLKPAGADALKQVGMILKDYPEYKVAVDGHTDSQPIRGALKKTFPTNMELSEARAANAATALGEGGLSAVTTHGYADTEPKAPNTTVAGRAKNRRVEVQVTK